MPRTIELDEVLVSERITNTWIEMLASVCHSLTNLYPDLIASDIPDERFRIKENGDGELFITVRQTRIALGVPKCEYILK